MTIKIFDIGKGKEITLVEPGMRRARVLYRLSRAGYRALGFAVWLFDDNGKPLAYKPSTDTRVNFKVYG